MNVSLNKPCHTIWLWKYKDLTFSKGCGEKAMSKNGKGTQWLSLTQAHCGNNSCKCP